MFHIQNLTVNKHHTQNTFSYKDKRSLRDGESNLLQPYFALLAIATYTVAFRFKLTFATLYIKYFVKFTYVFTKSLLYCLAVLCI